MEMLERMVKSVLIHAICHIIRHGLDFVATTGHGDANGAFFEHGDIDLGIAEGIGVLDIRMQLVKQHSSFDSYFHIRGFAPNS